MSDFIYEGDGFYDDEDERHLLMQINSSEPHVGCIVQFAPNSFFAKRGGKLVAKVISIKEPEDDGHGYINIKCLPGTDCYLSPGETESFPFVGWEKTLEVRQTAEDKDD